MKRRKFLMTLGAAGAGVVASPALLAQPLKKKSPVGVQLYTVRKAMGDDASGTLKALSKIGYTLVEGASYQEGKFYGKTAKEFRMMLEDNGLRMVSSHTATGRMAPQAKRTPVGGEWEAAVADFREVGQEYIVIPFLTPDERKTMDDYKKLAALLTKSAEVCSKYGLKMGYHNHDFEFQQLEGELPFDVLLRETDPALVNFELDIYWIIKAGHDPFAYFEKHSGRFPLWHVKDIDNTERRAFTEVGNGTIDWKKMFAARKKSGLDYFFVEQDVSPDPLASVKKSFDYLRGLKV